MDLDLQQLLADHGGIFCLLQAVLRRTRSWKETKLNEMESEATCAASSIMSIEVRTLKISLVKIFWFPFGDWFSSSLHNFCCFSCDCSFFYAFIDIGTPGAEYFVALDTASDLLWVPCECQQCATLSSPGTANTSNVKLPLKLKLLYLLRQSCASRLTIRSEALRYAEEPSGSLGLACLLL